jgi:serine/threonine-protein kinase HipA
VPEVTLVRVLDRDVYLIERFDRVIQGGKEQKVPFISGLSATQLHESAYDEWSYPRLCQAINKISNHPARDREELYKRMVFNILVNNDDDHLRNHGFIHVADNKWRLSKLFDVVPRDQQTDTFRLALVIGDFGKEASRRNALSAHEYFRLDSVRASNIWEEIETIVVNCWEKTFLESGMRQTEVDKFRNSIGVSHKLNCG